MLLTEVSAYLKGNKGAIVKGGGIALGVLGVLFILLKIIGIINWPWLAVLTPIWLPIISIAVLMAVLLCLSNLFKKTVLDKEILTPEPKKELIVEKSEKECSKEECREEAPKKPQTKEEVPSADKEPVKKKPTRTRKPKAEAPGKKTKSNGKTKEKD